MADLIFIRLTSPDGTAVEATASRYGGGKMLPPGQWSVFRSDAEEPVVMAVAEMPVHWRRQIHGQGRFGASLDI